MASRSDSEEQRLGLTRGRDQPERWLTFVHLDPFVAAWARMKLGDSELRALEFEILMDPTRPPTVAGTGGLRKLRFSPDSWPTGKSGALRVLYAHWPEHGIVALIYAYPKSETENITAQEKRQIKAMIEDIGRYLGRTKERRGVLTSKRKGKP